MSLDWLKIPLPRTDYDPEYDREAEWDEEGDLDDEWYVPRRGPALVIESVGVELLTEALMVLKNNLTFTRYVNRQYDKKFGIEGAKIGDTLNVRKPPRYLSRSS